MNHYAFLFLFSKFACAPLSHESDTAGLSCSESIVITCEDDEFDTGQMILHVSVPDWGDEYDSVQAVLGRLDADSLVGELHPTDTPCGTLWETEFRVFNVTCESIVTKEITRVSLLK